VCGGGEGVENPFCWCLCCCVVAPRCVGQIFPPLLPSHPSNVCERLKSVWRG
jgi:hypothetical protein